MHLRNPRVSSSPLATGRAPPPGCSQETRPLPAPAQGEEGSDGAFSPADCSAMTTAWYRPTWDLALDPLVSCKLCLGEYPVEQMTTLAQCRCVFCTLVGAGPSAGGVRVCFVSADHTLFW